MKITVKLRIYLGFLLLVAVSAVMFIVSFSGFNKIDNSVNQLSENNIPTLIAASNLSKNLLSSEISLKELGRTENKTNADSLKQIYDAYKTDASNALNELQTLVQNNKALLPIFNQSREFSVTFYDKSDQAISSLFEQIKIQTNTTELASEFGDMGDESLSAAYDLEGLTEDDVLATTIEDFVALIELTVDEANSGLNSGIKFEVLSIKSSIQGSVSELEQQLKIIQSSVDELDEDSVNAMTESFSAFTQALTGNNNALESKVLTLEQAQNVKEQIQIAEQAGLDVRILLDKLNEQINKNTYIVEQQAKNNVSSSKTISIILALISAVASIIIALYITTTITQPLQHSIAQLRKASKGDLTVQFTKFRNDEFSELSSDLQLLVDNLRKTIKEIADNSHTLASTAEETSAISDSSFSSIQQQNNQIQLVNTSVQEMTETAKSVSESVHQTLTEVEAANTNALEGEKLLKANTKNMSSLENKIMDSAKVIEDLNNNTNGISSVLDEIRGVAEQTNLLALNAAIEAARAGEQGRGFAVVADEVRTLASRAHDSTSEIQEAIEQLQRGAKNAVETMEQSKQETTQCVAEILGVQQKLESIVGGVEKIKDMSQLIATAAEQQNVATESQNANITEIQRVADETSLQAQENLQASQQLAEMAETQSEMVSKFKT